jgi:hypothetical protein
MRNISKYIILFAFLVCFDISVTSAQYIDNDTSDVVIRRTNKMLPKEYNISDVIIKLDKEKTKNIIRVDLEIPLRTTLRLSVSDTAGNKIMNLISDQTLTGGVYRVRWEMVRCLTDDCDFPPGKYWCEFETDQFIFQRDFYIK